MKTIKVAVAFLFLAGVTFAFAGQAFAYPPFLVKARKFGARDCTFCHVDPEGGPPWNERGKWLISEKERRQADAIDVEWLKDFNPSDAKTAPAEDKKMAEPAPAGIEAELMKIEREWMEAAGRHDRQALGRILADDFKATDERGRVVDKSRYIEDDLGLTVDSYSFNNVATHAYGDTAVVSYRLTFKGSHNGSDLSGDYRTTNVWVKRDGRWQAVAMHITRVTER